MYRGKMVLLSLMGRNRCLQERGAYAPVAYETERTGIDEGTGVLRMIYEGAPGFIVADLLRHMPF